MLIRIMTLLAWGTFAQAYPITVTTQNPITGHKPLVSGQLTLEESNGQPFRHDKVAHDYNFKGIRISHNPQQLQYDDIDGDPPDPDQPFIITNPRYQWTFNGNSVTTPDVCESGHGTYRLLASADVIPVSQFGSPRQGDAVRLSTQQEVVIKPFIKVNHFCFDFDEPFPTTGFNGASFTIELPGAGYRWQSSDSSHVTVSEGVVTLISDHRNPPLGKIITVTATQENEVVFKIKKWFYSPEPFRGFPLTFSMANDVCNNIGYRLPTDNIELYPITPNAPNNAPELTYHPYGQIPDSVSRGIGTLIFEWGSLEKYNNLLNRNLWFWTGVNPNPGRIANRVSYKGELSFARSNVLGPSAICVINL